MTDNLDPQLEQVGRTLRDTLVAYAPVAPSAAGLSAGAQSRARRIRHRRRLATACAVFGTVVAVSAVALLTPLLRGDDGQLATRPSPATPTSSGPSPTDGPSATFPAATPLALIGTWLLQGTDETAGVAWVIGPGYSVVFNRPCRQLNVDWRANTEGLFVADTNSGFGTPGAQDCRPGSDDRPDWLRKAASYAVEGDSRVLRDVDGEVVARLLPSGPITAPPGVPEDLVEPPVVTDEERRLYSSPALPLPPGLVPASPAALVGRWVPADGSTAAGGRAAYIQLDRDGDYTGSDGCNGSGGRWEAGPDGASLATDGPTTAAGCDNIDVRAWFAEAARAGFDGDVLVLFDERGNETGRVRKEAG